MTLKQLVHGRRGNLLKLTQGLSVPKPGIPPALLNVSLAQPIFSVRMLYLFPTLPWGAMSLLASERMVQTVLQRQDLLPAHLLSIPLTFFLFPSRLFRDALFCPLLQGIPPGLLLNVGKEMARRSQGTLFPDLGKSGDPRTLGTWYSLLPSTKSSPLPP